MSTRLQLPLPFPHAPGYDVRDFLPAAANQHALAWLGAEWPDRRLVLWGPAGCGKSHLLHVWAERTGALLLSGPMLGRPVQTHDTKTPAPLAPAGGRPAGFGPAGDGPDRLTDQALRSLDAIPPDATLALDDADTVVSETGLLHLLNTARERALHVLLAGRTPPSRWPARLPDLSSRLRSIVAVEIRPPGDDLLAALLVHLLADRQLTVPQSVQDWMLTRLPRSPSALRQAVAVLDQASLASGRPISRAFAASVLRDHTGSAADADDPSMPEFAASTHPPAFR